MANLVADSTLNSMGTHLAGLYAYAQAHTGDPGSAGTSNVSTAGRQAVTWTVDADGDLSLTATVSFTGGAASGPCTWLSFWSAASNGTWRGNYQLTGDTAFNAAGEVDLTALPITGTAT